MNGPLGFLLEYSLFGSELEFVKLVNSKSDHCYDFTSPINSNRAEVVMIEIQVPSLVITGIINPGLI